MIENGAEQTLIGGFQPSARNLISGNVGDGILIAGIAGNPSSDNRIAGNYIGVDITGESAITNNARGVTSTTTLKRLLSVEIASMNAI